MLVINESSDVQNIDDSKHNSSDSTIFERDPGAMKRQELAWVKYSILTSVSIGLVNYLLGDLSARLGIAGSFPIFYGIILMGILYHCAQCAFSIDRTLSGEET